MKKSRRKLRTAELRILDELVETPDDPARRKRWDGVWYFPEKNLRTLQSLAALGLAEPIDHERSPFGARYGYRITAAGVAARETGRAS